MNLPNCLTLSRFVFGVIIMFLLFCNTSSTIVAATVLFIIAALTDYFDGYFAKKQGLITDFGKIMDPIADKVMMIFVFIALAYLGMMDWWMIVLIVVREVAVTVSRLKAMSRGHVLAAEQSGKIKTVCQMVSVSFALLFLICEQSSFARPWFYQVETMWRALVQLLMLISVFLTVSSGISYFRNKWRNDKNIFYEVIATFFWVGYSPVASGTAATAAGLVVVYFLHANPLAYVLVLLGLLGLGIIAADRVEKASGKKDPGIVVIDEIVGIMIAMLGIPLTWSTVLCGFFLFRAIDMFKIYPVNKFEAIPGGMGIMLDDVMAGLYTNLILIIAVHYAGLI